MILYIRTHLISLYYLPLEEFQSEHIYWGMVAKKGLQVDDHSKSDT